MLNTQTLKGLGENGWIPGPEESEEAFLKRIETLEIVNQSQREFLKKGESVFYDGTDSLILGANPKWLTINYSNSGLLPWQGAALWVFKTADGTSFPVVQLRKAFKKGHFLFYDRDEVVQHETLHAIRIAFDEPQFEEILAYFHSKRKWRAFLGPIFRKPSQVLFFVTLILISLSLQFTGLFFLYSPYHVLFKMGGLLPFLDLAIRFGSLIKDRSLLKRTLKKLKNLFPKLENTFPVALRLNDLEIQQFAKQSLEDILIYIKKESPQSIRWQQILAQFS